MQHQLSGKPAVEPAEVDQGHAGTRQPAEMALKTCSAAVQARQRCTASASAPATTPQKAAPTPPSVSPLAVTR
jgi:hypothetical protein